MDRREQVAPLKGSHEQEHDPLTGAVDRLRWLALVPLCLAVLMIVMNATSVNVALPSIKLDLHFSEGSLAWVVTAYLATFGGFLLLGGGVGDLFGRRRLFLIGISCFILASLGCGLANSLGTLLAGRLVQGFGAAIVSAMVLSQIMGLFTDPTQRVRAAGVYSFVGASGGGIGLLLGGFLTSELGWQWVFFANVPIGVIVYVLGIALLPSDSEGPLRGRVDVAGALTISSSLMLALYAILDVSRAGWGSGQTLILLATTGLLLVLFFCIEARAQTPLMPLELFKMRDLTVVSVAGVLLSAAILACSFISALYLQLVLGSTPFQIGLALLPANLAIAAMSLLISPVLVARFGSRRLLVAGMLLASVGLAFLARVPMIASVVVDVLPGMLLLGIGAGMAYNPLCATAFRDVPPSRFGTASGIINTAFTMGGALGLSGVASIAAVRTSALLASGSTVQLALQSGYRVGFYISAGFAVLAALISGVFLRDRKQPYRDLEPLGEAISDTQQGPR